LSKIRPPTRWRDDSRLALVGTLLDQQQMIATVNQQSLLL
jgi:hypothetical protein